MTNPIDISTPSKPSVDSDETFNAVAEKGVSTLSEPAIQPFRSKKSARDEGDCMAHFSQTKAIGSGNFATVHRSIHTPTKSPVALKTLVKSTSPKFVARERWCLENLTHPNIVKTVDAVARELGSSFKTADGSIVLVQECANRGDLFDFVSTNAEMSVNVQAKALVKQMLHALSYLHSNDVVHLDVKLENMLLHKACTSSKLQVKLADFGLCQVSTKFGDDVNAVVERNGTTEYMAPEMHASRKAFGGKQADMWAAGVCFFMMLTGFPPMTVAKPSCPWFSLIKRGRHTLFWERVDRVLKQNGREVPCSLAKGLVNKLLNVDPSSRFTADNALAHPFCCESAGLATSIDSLEHVCAKISNKTAMRKWFTIFRKDQQRLGSLCQSLCQLASKREAAAAFCHWKRSTKMAANSMRNTMRIRIFSGSLSSLLAKSNLRHAILNWKGSIHGGGGPLGKDFTPIVQCICLCCALLGWVQIE